jgi:hypothetical protein
LERGEADSRAQSKGECPGDRSTLRRGFVGMFACVGGGKREEEEMPRSGRGERKGGNISPTGGVWAASNRGGPRTPLEALCAELSAGNEGMEAPPSVYARVRQGLVEVRGVVGESSSFGGEEGFWEVGGVFSRGGGGGGIALRSRSSFRVTASLPY